MTPRRLLASLVVALWSLPAALATGVLLHVALEHAPAGEPSFRSSAQSVAPGGGRLAAAAEHEHEVSLASDPPLRRGNVPNAVPPQQGAVEVASSDSGPGCGVPTSVGPPSPRARGPALLALLSVLRV